MCLVLKGMGFKKYLRKLVNTEIYTVHDMFCKGVYVDVPPSTSDESTITLRGSQDKMGETLTLVYSKVTMRCNFYVISVLLNYLHFQGTT